MLRSTVSLEFLVRMSSTIKPLTVYACCTAMLQRGLLHQVPAPPGLQLSLENPSAIFNTTLIA